MSDDTSETAKQLKKRLRQTALRNEKLLKIEESIIELTLSIKEDMASFEKTIEIKMDEVDDG